MSMVPGVRLATAAAGIRYADREDLLLIELAEGTQCAAVFTRNAFCAAPVVVAKEHLAGDNIRYLLVNAGNANAGTGDEGLRVARETCRAVASVAGCAMDQVLPFSTGVIGEPLPLEPFTQAMPDLFRDLSADAWPAAAGAIMTTDTRPKLATRQLALSQGKVTITGIAKGSGMICPDMATMLAYVATDARINADLLQSMLMTAVDESFNRITVDGDTSTNDACVLVASGTSDVVIDDLTSEDARLLQQTLSEVCGGLAEMIVRDGEGATKFVSIEVRGAFDLEEARRVGYTVAHSPLVKTALFAADPNWGRILAAVGRSGVGGLDVERVRIWLGDALIVSRGGRAPDYSESQGRDAMAADDISIVVDLGRGDARTEIQTCDLSYDYVKINAEYRT